MPANSYPNKWSSDELLKAVEQLPAHEVDQLYRRLGAMRSHRRGGSLPANEATLLLKINQGFSDDWWEHYQELLEKRRDETLTKVEHRELLRLTDQIEQREAKRMQALVQLAKLRQRSLRGLMKELGLTAKTHA